MTVDCVPQRVVRRASQRWIGDWLGGKWNGDRLGGNRNGDWLAGIWPLAFAVGGLMNEGG